MTRLNQLIIERTTLENEAKELLKKHKDIEFRRRVAEEEGSESRLLTIQAEMKVLSQMAQETNQQIQKIKPQIEELELEFSITSRKFEAYSGFCFIFSIGGIFAFFEGFSIGIIWVVLFLSIGIYFRIKSSDQKAFSMGITEDQLNKIKSDAKARAAKEDSDRKAMAKAIHDEFNKR